MSLCAVAGAALLCLFHATRLDLLLLTSDLPSLLIYVCAMEVGLTLTGLLLFSPYWLLPPPGRIALRRYATTVVAATLLLVVIQSLLSLLALSSPIMDAYRAFFAAQARTTILTVLLKQTELLVSGALFFLVWLVHRMPDIRRRCELLGTVLLVMAPSGMAFGYYAMARPTAESPPRHVVVIVLDGLGADTMATLRSDPGGDPLAGNLPDSDLSMVTAMPYTMGFFGAFYTGRLDCERHSSLLGRLQKAGVAVRWLSFHRNGFPDTTRCPRSDYRGLRSYALSPTLAAVPRALGLDYDVTLSGQDPSDPALVDKILLPELKQLAHRPRSFALVHIPATPPEIAAYADLRATQRALELARYVKEHNYTYPPRMAQEVAAEGAQYRAGAMRVLVNMARLIAAIRRSPALMDSIVILTADHGTVFGGGHLYYGYHADHPVIFTPLLVFGLKLPKPHGTLYTPDLTSTIGSLFQVPENGFLGKSIIGPEAGHAEVASLTLAAPGMQRWLLALTTPEGSDVYNLDPNGDGKAGIISAQSPFATALEHTPSRSERDRVRSWLKSFAVPPNQVFARFR